MSDRWLYGWGLGYAAVGGASLLLPLYALELGAGVLLVGLMASSAAFAGVPGALLWGRLAARSKRRRPFILVALGAAGGVLALVPFLGSPLAVLVANAALWFVVSAAAPVLNLVVVEGTPESAWGSRLGLLQSRQGYGWVGGLVVGVAWSAVVPPLVGPRTAQELLCLVLGGVALLAFGVVFRWYPDPSTLSTARFRRAYRRLRTGSVDGGNLRTVPFGPGRLYWTLTTLRGPAERRGFSPSLRRYLAAVALFSVGFAVFWGPMPAYLTGRGYADDAVFALFLLGNLGSALCYAPVGRASGRFDPFRLQAGALAARVLLFPAVALVGLTSLPATPLFALCFVAIGVTWAVIAVTAAGLVTRLASADVRGEALGSYTAVVGVGTGVGSAVGGGIAQVAGYPVAFGVAAALVLCGLALSVGARVTPSPSPAKSR